MHSTNYFNTLILVSPDTKAEVGRVPNKEGSVAALQFQMIWNAPYALTSDDVIFGVFAMRKNIALAEREDARKIYFSKGQACLRASPLVKTHGWGVHADEQGRIALFGVESAQYADLSADDSVTKIAGMRSKRA